MENRVIWFTGLSGSGKTTIAMATADCFGCEVLDGDTIRDFFTNHDFTREGRERHLLGIAKMANMISKQISIEASVLPFSILFERCEWVDSVMGARVGSILRWFD